MSFETVRRDIFKRLQDNWATTVIDVPNHKFTPPKDGAYIKARLVEGQPNRLNIGTTGHYRHPGILVINIFVPRGTGTKTGRGYADTLAALFRNVQFNGIQFEEATVNELGEVGNHYQINMISSFWWIGSYV